MHTRSSLRQFHLALIASLAALAASGCRTTVTEPPLRLADDVDIPRFMGDWYVIANIPTFIEKEAYNAVESYRLAEDGRILTRFTFREGSFDGPLKEYNPVGFVEDHPSNAVWGMRFIWPFKADYRIVYVDEEYATTIIGRNARDHVWIMARTPQVPRETYEELVRMVVEQGYERDKLRRVPQRWDARSARSRDVSPTASP